MKNLPQKCICSPRGNYHQNIKKILFFPLNSFRTAISVGDAVNNQESTKEQIFENIRLHKEVLQSVKLQPWSMRRKLRLVRQVSILSLSVTFDFIIYLI